MTTMADSRLGQLNTRNLTLTYVPEQLAQFLSRCLFRVQSFWYEHSTSRLPIETIKTEWWRSWLYAVEDLVRRYAVTLIIRRIEEAWCWPGVQNFRGQICNPAAALVESVADPRPLVPIVHDLEQDGTAEFRFVQGSHEIKTPKEHEDFYGPPPHFSFSSNIDVEDVRQNGVIRRAEQVGDSPEATYRNNISPEHFSSVRDGIMESIDRCNKICETEGPFEVMIGFSEGAWIGATLLVDQMKRSRAGAACTFKMAIFLSGSPPLDLDDSGRPMLADTDGQVLKIPTVHVFGSADVLLFKSMSLYNLCDPDIAELFDHGHGHQSVWWVQLVTFRVQSAKWVILVGKNEP